MIYICAQKFKQSWCTKVGCFVETWSKKNVQSSGLKKAFVFSLKTLVQGKLISQLILQRRPSEVWVLKIIANVLEFIPKQILSGFWQNQLSSCRKASFKSCCSSRLMLLLVLQQSPLEEDRAKNAINRKCLKFSV